MTGGWRGKGVRGQNLHVCSNDIPKDERMKDQKVLFALSLRLFLFFELLSAYVVVNLTLKLFCP